MFGQQQFLPAQNTGFTPQGNFAPAQVQTAPAFNGGGYQASVQPGYQPQPQPAFNGGGYPAQVQPQPQPYPAYQSTGAPASSFALNNYQGDYYNNTYNGDVYNNTINFAPTIYQAAQPQPQAQPQAQGDTVVINNNFFGPVNFGGAPAQGPGQQPAVAPDMSGARMMPNTGQFMPGQAQAGNPMPQQDASGQFQQMLPQLMGTLTMMMGAMTMIFGMMTQMLLQGQQGQTQPGSQSPGPDDGSGTPAPDAGGDTQAPGGPDGGNDTHPDHGGGNNTQPDQGGDQPGGSEQPGGAEQPGGSEQPDDAGQPEGPQPQAQAEDLQTVIGQFARIDTDQNGVLDDNELQAARNRSDDPEVKQILNALSRNDEELMFANIDPGNAAWHGLSIHDLRRIEYRLSQGESLRDIKNDLKSEITRERGVEGNFRHWVQERRDRVPNN